MSEVAAAMPMPKYRSHKEVWALKISGLQVPAKGDVVLRFSDEGFESMTVPPEVVSRYWPVPGDYLVTYPDGYQSISPGKAFEEGYTRL